jgi:outer membrane receptor for ferrienterochelin and colicins
MRIELRAGVTQSRWTFDARNLRSGVLRQRSVGGGSDDGITQAGKYSLLLGSSHTLTAGWDLEHRDREERRTTTDAAGQPVDADFEGQPFDAQVRRHALYVQDEWELSPQWQLYLGLRSERITTNSGSTGAPVRNTSSVTSPLLHLTYKFDPKGRDQIRASLTRSYKAPNLGTLLARPVRNAQYPNRTDENTALAPDRIGNPLLAPELATGLDIAYENYLANGGLVSIGLFHRRLTDVVRNTLTQRTVSWADVPRWVSEPQNFSDATTSGLEFEAKGSAADLLPKAVAGMLPNARALNLRASVNLYRSKVAAAPGPDNRLDGQQPWSANFGFDRRLTGLPLNIGGSIGFNPAYDTRLTADQLVQRSRTRSIDLFAQLAVRPGLSVRLAASAGVQPFGPPNQTTNTVLANGDFSSIERHTKPQINLSLDMRL